MTNGIIFDFQRELIPSNLIKNNLLTKKPDPKNEDILIENITSIRTTPDVEQWRTFFLTDFSIGFLNRIASDLYKNMKSGEDIQGEYYMFISPIGGENSIPYYKVSLFSRQKDASLKSYLSTITTRFFYNKKKRETAKTVPQTSYDDAIKLKINFSGNEVIENPWFALLISSNEEELLSANNSPLMEKLHKMINKLPQREQTVLELSYFDSYTGDAIFEVLLNAGLINPKRDVGTLTSKDKQNAVANIRKRALLHLKTLMEQ